MNVLILILFIIIVTPILFWSIMGVIGMGLTIFGYGPLARDKHRKANPDRHQKLVITIVDETKKQPEENKS